MRSSAPACTAAFAAGTSIDDLVSVADCGVGEDVVARLLVVSAPPAATQVQLETEGAAGFGAAGLGVAGLGVTGFGQLISAARARWLACDAVVSRIVMGPEGTPLDLGRRHRVVTPALRRAVVARDKTCVFTGCHAPHWWADVHHIVHWIDGGETSLTNSALLCGRHHGKVHHGFQVKREPDGRWRTWRPDGTEIIIGPRITDELSI